MRASVAAMVLNVAGNWLLIDGRLGAPALGVRGAALASAISTTLAFLGLLAVFLREGRRGGGSGRLRGGELLRVVRYGVPSGLNWFLEFLAFAFFTNVVVAGLGTTSLAALMAVIQVNSVAFMPAFGVASAGAILVGQAIGAGAKDRVPGLVGLAFAVAGAWQALVGLVYLVVPDLVLAAFAQDPGSAQELLAAGRRMLLLSVGWQLFDAAASVLAEALRAAGDTTFTLWARVVIAWAVFAPGQLDLRAGPRRGRHGGGRVARRVPRAPRARPPREVPRRGVAADRARRAHPARLSGALRAIPATATPAPCARPTPSWSAPARTGSPPR